MVHVTVPNLITHDAINRILAIKAQTARLRSDDLHLDCGNLGFVDPLGLCILHHWFQDLGNRDVTVNVENLSRNLESWLTRMDLFSGVDNLVFASRRGNAARNDRVGNLVEIRSVTRIDEIDATASRIANTIITGIDDVSFEPDPEGMRPSPGEQFIRLTEYVFAEILLNALDHGRKRGYIDSHAKVAAQYYPKRQRLQIAIVDNGCGLLETLQAHPKMEGDLTHRKAIDIALQPRVSCNRDLDTGRDARNQGVGLTVSSQIALRSGGRIGIFSGDGWVKKFSGGGHFRAHLPAWQGTAVFLEIDRNRINSVDFQQIMQSLPGFRIVPDLNFG